MKPKPPPIKDKQGHLFKIELIRIINKAHPMVKLANVINWDRLEEVFGKSYCPNNGRPARCDWSPEQISGRFKRMGLISLHHETIYKYILTDKK